MVLRGSTLSVRAEIAFRLSSIGSEPSLSESLKETWSFPITPFSPPSSRLFLTPFLLPVLSAETIGASDITGDSLVDTTSLDGETGFFRGRPGFLTEVSSKLFDGSGFGVVLFEMGVFLGLPRCLLIGVVSLLTSVSEVRRDTSTLCFSLDVTWDSDVGLAESQDRFSAPSYNQDRKHEISGGSKFVGGVIDQSTA